MFGHIWKAITTPVAAAPRRDLAPAHIEPADGAAPLAPPTSGAPLHRTVQEQETISPDGRVILRRTTIEEVEIRQQPPEQGGGPPVQ